MSNDKEEKKSDSFTPEEPETEIRDDKENIHRESVMEDQSEAQAAMPNDDAEDADDTAEEILDDDAENDDTMIPQKTYRMIIQNVRTRQIKCQKVQKRRSEEDDAEKEIWERNHGSLQAVL